MYGDTLLEVIKKRGKIELTIQQKDDLLFAFEKNDRGFKPVIGVYHLNGINIDTLENYAGKTEDAINHYYEETLDDMRTVINQYTKILIAFDEMFEDVLGHTHEDGVIIDWFYNASSIDIMEVKNKMERYLEKLKESQGVI